MASIEATVANARFTTQFDDVVIVALVLRSFIRGGGEPIVAMARPGGPRNVGPLSDGGGRTCRAKGDS
jgi:hypothetical protein